MLEFIRKIKSRFGNEGLIVGAVLIVGIVVVLYKVIVPVTMSVSQNMGITNSYGILAEKAAFTDEYSGATRGGGVSSNYTMPPYPGDVPAATAEILKADRKIIKNGSLDILVKRAEKTASDISQIAARHSGFLDQSNIYEVSEGAKAGSVTVRVPSDQFSKVMDEIKKLAVKVRNENTSSSDVTAQYVDLEARLKNLKAEEAQYLEIMKKAVKIEDILNVSQRLYIVRGQIESTQGQLNYLSRQVDMSVIYVNLTSEAEVEVFGIIWRPLTVLKQALKDSLTDLTRLTDWLIVSIFKLPALILKLAIFGFILVVLWKIFRFFGRGLFKSNNQKVDY